MLRELVPIATTIAMIINPNNPAAEADTMEVQAAALAVGVQLQLLKASTECGIDS